jgi:hypothetical protein
VVQGAGCCILGILTALPRPNAAAAAFAAVSAAAPLLMTSVQFFFQHLLARAVFATRLLERVGEPLSWRDWSRLGAALWPLPAITWTPPCLSLRLPMVLYNVLMHSLLPCFCTLASMRTAQASVPDDRMAVLSESE